MNAGRAAVNVHIVSFARIRDIIGQATLDRTLRGDATAGDAWDDLAREFPQLAELENSTRIVRNGAFVARAESLRDGDELAFLPPFGGG